jgi:hypothetical protein
LKAEVKRVVLVKEDEKGLKRGSDMVEKGITDSLMRE